jgi:hypothetical protein
MKIILDDWKLKIIYVVQNQLSIANEIKNYFLNVAGSTSTKGIHEKKEDASPLQYLFEYFNQPFKDISWPAGLTPPQKK